MSAGTSTVSTSTQTTVISSRANILPLSLPTSLPAVQLLQRRALPSPTCCPNKVVISLSTTIVIPDYSLYYRQPIESFKPKYYALDDGSLIAPPFIQDLAGANVSLLITGILTMLFVRNIIVSGDYIRRGKVKRKALFYVLFLSQILAPVSFVPIIMSYFNQFLNCTAVIILSCLSSTASLALLITGILGVKAYKCLNNSRFVLVVLGLFQCASSGIVAMDTATMRGERRLSGSCVRISDLLCTRIFVLIQFFESLFICCCFMYACWRSRGSTDARGRISIQLSMEDLPVEVPSTTTEKQQTLRGWWDYVPNTQAPSPPQPLPASKPSLPVRQKLVGLLGGAARKSQLTPPQPSNSTRIRISETPSDRHLISHPYENRYSRGRNSPTPSSLSRLAKLVPHMELFQKVMKDELLYTTFITATCVVVAILAVIGVNSKNGLTVTGWIALNWCVISLLAIHSFGRVVHRHERDALLQHPATWNARIRSINALASTHRPQSTSSSQVRFQGRAEDDDANNPFSDNGSQISYPVTASPSLSSGLRISENFQTVPTSPSINSSFPTSGRDTPVVPHQSSGAGHGFSESWLFDRTSISTYGHEKNEEKVS